MDVHRLADDIVSLGVGSTVTEYDFEAVYWIDDGRTPVGGMSAKDFVEDWRVVGALMQMLPAGLNYEFFMPHYPENPGGWWWAVAEPDGAEGQDDSLPRAICKACVNALKPEIDNDYIGRSRHGLSLCT